MNATAFRFNDYIVVRTAAAAPAQTPERDPAASHIGFLIDTSGSMSGARILSVKRTLDAARSLFRETDTVSLVTFNSVGVTLLARQRMDNEGIERFYATVNDIAVGGSTNLSVGLERLIEIGTDYTTLIILTDGHINEGITSKTGLKAMALAVCCNGINTLGYGPDHSRALLSDLAIASRGSYTYADTDEVLPVIIGDILSGVRNMVFQQVKVSIPARDVTCLELGGGDRNTYNIGNIVADRDYWTVFKCGSAVSAVNISAESDRAAFIATEIPIVESDAPVIQEQVLRSRIAAKISAVSDILERGSDISGSLSVRTDLEALQAEILGLPDIIRQRALVLRMTGQITEALEMLREFMSRAADSHIRRAIPLAHQTSRLSSGVAHLATQRGFYRDEGIEDPTAACMFSSPAQHTGSRAVHATYSLDPTVRSVAGPGVSSP